MKYILIALLACASLHTIAQDKQPVQCAALAKGNEQCTSIAKDTPSKDGKQYCSRHNPDKLKCTGVTRSGTPCQHAPVKGGAKCSQHYFQKTK